MCSRDPSAARDNRHSENAWVLLLLCVLLAFHLVANLWWLRNDNHAIGSDEAMHMELARTYYKDLVLDTSKPIVERLLAFSAHENLYGPLLHLLGVFAIARFGYSTDVIASVGTGLFLLFIAGMYVLGRELFDKRRALFVAFVASFTPIIYGSSRYFMTDFMSTTVIVWAMYCLLKTDSYRRTGWVFVFAALMGLGILVRQTTFLFCLVPCGFAVLLGFWGLFPGRPGGDFKTWLLNIALTVVVAAGIGAPWYILQLRYQYTFWTGSRGQEHLLLSPMELLARIPIAPLLLLAVLGAALAWLYKRSPAPVAFKKRLWILAFAALFLLLIVPTKWSVYPVYVINNGVFLPMFLLAFAGMLVAFGGRRPKLPVLMALLWLLGSYALMTALFKTATPRYILPLIPALAMFAVMALGAIPQDKWRKNAAWAFSALLIFQYGNLTFFSYGPLANLQLPLGSKNFHNAEYADNGIALYKDQLIVGNYGLRAAQRHDGFTDRILKTMARDINSRRYVNEAWANYQRLSDGEQFEGLYFEQEHYWPPPNPFMTKALRPEDLPQCRLRAIGARWYEGPKDLLDNLPATDFVLLRVNATAKAPEREQDWRGCFERKGFEVIDHFLEPKHNVYPAGYYTVMGRRVRELEVAKEWDFAALDTPHWEWDFGRTAQKTQHGAACTLEANGTGPQSGAIKVSARAVDVIRVEMFATQGADAEEQPTEISNAHLYWARPEDLGESEWPFADERAVPMRQVDKHNPNIWEASVSRHRLWGGRIRRLFIGLDMPALEPKELSVVRGWDFAELNKGKWEWTFEGGAEQALKGALRMTTDSGPAARLINLDLNASDLAAVRVKVSATHKSAAGEIPVDIQQAHLYWARTTDVKGGEWPFGDDRAVAFKRPGQDAPDVWEAVVAKHGNWYGTIAQMCIGVDLPTDKLLGQSDFFILYFTAIDWLQSDSPLGVCNLHVKIIELLK